MRPHAHVVVPVRQHVLEATGSIREHAVAVHLDGDDLHAARLRLAQDGTIHEGLDQQARTVADVVDTGAPRVGQELERLGEAVGRAAGEDHLGSTLVRHRRVQVLARELADEGAERRVAFGGSILQGSCQVNLADRVCLLRGLRDRDVVCGLGVCELDRRQLCREGVVDLFASRGRPSLWLGRLGLEGVEGEELRIR